MIHDYKLAYTIFSQSVNHGEYILAVESALKKQIPRKPILDTIFPSGIEWYLCPACNHNNIEKSDCFCHNCGQALDWRDTE